MTHARRSINDASLEWRFGMLSVLDVSSTGDHFNCSHNSPRLYISSCSDVYFLNPATEEKRRKNVSGVMIILPAIHSCTFTQAGVITGLHREGKKEMRLSLLAVFLCISVCVKVFFSLVRAKENPVLQIFSSSREKMKFSFLCIRSNLVNAREIGCVLELQRVHGCQCVFYLTARQGQSKVTLSQSNHPQSPLSFLRGFCVRSSCVNDDQQINIGSRTYEIKNCY